MFKAKKRFLLCVGLLAASASAYSQTGFVDAEVTRIQVASDNTFGGCSATLSRNISESGFGDCDSKFVTFDCQAEWLSKSESQALLSQTQLALVAGYRARFHIDNTRKHRYCLAYRVDIIEKLD